VKVRDALALLSFFTVWPSRRSSLDDVARAVVLLPFIGVVTGLCGAIFVLLGYVLPSGVAAVLALAAVLISAGFHHADGVLDTGDALMAHGEPERRRAILKDARVGIGGLGALFVVYGPALAALVAMTEASPWRAAVALISAEIAVRSTMLIMLTLGTSAKSTSSSAPFTKVLSGDYGQAALAVAALIPAAALASLGFPAVLTVVAVPLVAGIALRVSRNTFGGISGDLIGAGGEATRMVVLVILSAVI